MLSEGAATETLIPRPSPSSPVSGIRSFRDCLLHHRHLELRRIRPDPEHLRLSNDTRAWLRFYLMFCFSNHVHATKTFTETTLTNIMRAMTKGCPERGGGGGGGAEGPPRGMCFYIAGAIMLFLCQFYAPLRPRRGPTLLLLHMTKETNRPIRLHG